MTQVLFSEIFKKVFLKQEKILMGKKNKLYQKENIYPYPIGRHGFSKK